MKNLIKYSKNFINNLLKVCLNNHEYDEAIDFLTDNMRRDDFKLNGQNEILFRYDMYFIIAIDTLDKYKIKINTNIIQTKTFEFSTGRIFTGFEKDFHLKNEIPYIKDWETALKYLRKEKLEKLMRVKTI